MAQRAAATRFLRNVTAAGPRRRDAPDPVSLLDRDGFHAGSVALTHAVAHRLQTDLFQQAVKTGAAEIMMMLDFPQLGFSLFPVM